MIGDGTQVIDGDGRRHGWRRPVAIPDDMDDGPKAADVIELPLRVDWSSERRSWDLRDERERAQVYEMVLTEGTDDDVRAYIQIDTLVALWPKLFLPAHVRRAWVDHVRRTRHIDLEC